MGENLLTFLEKQSARERAGGRRGQGDRAEKTPRQDTPEPQVLLINCLGPWGAPTVLDTGVRAPAFGLHWPPPLRALLGQVC